MIHLKSCWSPCFWHGNVRDGSYAVGIYTICMSVCIITYCIYVLSGGDASQLWLPFFETDLKSGSLQGSAGFTIFFFLLFLVFSAILLFGIQREIRGFLLPWKYAMYVVILFQIMFGLWMIFGYYIYLEMVFAALCNWAWMAFNIYCLLVVKSHLRNVKYYQSPDIEYLNDI